MVVLGCGFLLLAAGIYARGVLFWLQHGDWPGWSVASLLLLLLGEQRFDALVNALGLVNPQTWLGLRSLLLWVLEANAAYAAGIVGVVCCVLGLAGDDARARKRMDQEQREQRRREHERWERDRLDHEQRERGRAQREQEQWERACREEDDDSWG